MREFARSAIGQAIRQRRAQIALGVIVVALAAASLQRVFGSALARAQSNSGASTGSSEGLEAAVVPPPPEPCAAQPSGPCPAGACTTDVPGASNYENGLPVPSPAPGFNYVVQLVNESDKTILAAANAPNQGSSSPGGPVPSPVPVEPREGTWVMQPKGAPNNGNILTIDIPAGWEATQCPQTNKSCEANGPRFYPRTGCKYDIEHNLAQCETGTCGDAYDCGKQALRTPPLASDGTPPVSIVEWTFNSQGGQGYDYPDISLVDGVSITIDVQALGPHCASKPGAPEEPNWLSQNQPLSIHGSDLREADRCIPSFRLTRGEVGQIIQGQGNPDDVVACFTNCGRYEHPKPAATCDPTTDERCKNWLAFCCYTPPGDPNNVYGGMCTVGDQQCEQHQSAGCWDTGSGSPTCECRAFNKAPGCLSNVCTHPWTPSTKSSQPPFGLCTDVTDDPTACIGDDIVHEVFPGGYTWPSDPQTYLSDARAYRIIFAPGYVPDKNPPITDSGPIPLCSTLPEVYGYATQAQNCSDEIKSGALFAGAAATQTCATQDDCPIIPGSGGARYGCINPPGLCATWSCEIADGGPVTTGTFLCRWSAAGPTPTATQLSAPPPTARRSAADSDSCAINPKAARGGGMLALGAVVALLYARRRLR